MNRSTAVALKQASCQCCGSHLIVEQITLNLWSLYCAYQPRVLLARRGLKAEEQIVNQWPREAGVLFKYIKQLVFEVLRYQTRFFCMTLGYVYLCFFIFWYVDGSETKEITLSAFLFFHLLICLIPNYNLRSTGKKAICNYKNTFRWTFADYYYFFCLIFCFAISLEFLQEDYPWTSLVSQSTLNLIM